MTERNEEASVQMIKAKLRDALVKEKKMDSEEAYYWAKWITGKLSGMEKEGFFFMSRQNGECSCCGTRRPGDYHTSLCRKCEDERRKKGPTGIVLDECEVLITINSRLIADAT